MESKYQILKKYFGYDKFRKGQEQLIDSILNGCDCLGVMPTGAGKSICFQVPALMFDGISLVISPLISLMKDQVNSLTQAGIRAAYINSSLTERQIKLVMENSKKGFYKIIYVAPERLETVEFLNFANQVDISMLTVDEAHCISQWGQDFRPSYLNIVYFLDKLSKRPVISSFTATATPNVRDDIINMLKLHNPDILVTSFDRKNLNFSVKKSAQKFNDLIEFLSDKNDKSGIVYCSTRKNVEEVCERLNDSGYMTSRYHAGLSNEERQNNQEDFLYDRAKIMVATNAFGMGIDKSNVGFVVHYNMPKDIESYYQEAGRAGRDGEPASCLLLYNGRDVHTNKFLIENNRDTGSFYSEIEENNIDDYEIYIEDNTNTDVKSDQLLLEQNLKRLKEMTFYCHTSECLRGYILKYFGETTDNYCGNCSNCLSNFYSEDITIESQKILSCVIKSGERFGITTIISILRGSKNEKIKRFGFDKLSTYNISSMTEKQLKDIINHLILNEFLLVTDEKYPVLKRGIRATEVLRGNISIEMKMLKEISKPKSTSKEVSKNLRPVNTALMNNLKALRLQIANEQSLPAFVIFHDSTLTDMCMKLPTSELEFLQVSGVGEIKLKSYGKRFLEVIAEFKEKNIDNLDLSENKSDLDTLNNLIVETSEEPITVNVIASRVNTVRLQRGLPTITGAKINRILISEGYLEVRDDENGEKFKFPTEFGKLNSYKISIKIYKYLCKI